MVRRSRNVVGDKGRVRDDNVRSIDGIGKENIRNIQKSKRSYYVTLPISYLRRLGWDEPGKPVVVKMSGRNLVIEDFRGNSPDFKLQLSAGMKWRKNQ